MQHLKKTKNRFSNAMLKRKIKNDQSRNKAMRNKPSTVKEKASKVKTSYSKRKAAAMENDD